MNAETRRAKAVLRQAYDSAEKGMPQPDIVRATLAYLEALRVEGVNRLWRMRHELPPF